MTRTKHPPNESMPVSAPGHAETRRAEILVRPIYLIFFLSGFAALLYQLAWQRALFTMYGVNIESITVVVAAFMAGLGLGSLLGGVVSRTVRLPLAVAFGLAELAIGAYGFASLTVYKWADGLTAGAPAAETFALSFGLVAVPTLLMGATLPILVAFLVRRSNNVGRSVGTLYFTNTLGGAAACFAVALWLFATLGLSGTVKLAATLNVLIGTGAVLFHLVDRHRGDPAAERVGRREQRHAGAAVTSRLALTAVLAALAGFISLSYEILWVRMYSFASGGSPVIFPVFLAFFLMGIAVGAYFSQRLCDRDDAVGSARHLEAVAWFVLGANIVGFLTVPTLAQATASSATHWVWTLVLVLGAAAALGATFPLLSHFGIPADERAGARLSYLYLANIAGSTGGSLLTGFVLLEFWSARQISVFLLLLGCGASATIFLLRQARTPRMLAGIACGLTAGIIGVASADTLFERLYEKLLDKGNAGASVHVVQVNESRSGVITVDERGRVFGGGAYDGHFSVDLVEDRNGIIRPFALSALHPAPRTVLMIGIGSGSWSQVMAHNPYVEHVTIVEVNPGYYELVTSHPVTASLASNPKVEKIVDDGRRWLRANPQRKFDAIVMNTTFHWRAMATNLLSVEFLEIIRRHLNPGGIYCFNSTSSGEAQKTAATVYPHALRLSNMVVASDSPIEPDTARWRDVLSQYTIDGDDVFDLEVAKHRARLDQVVGIIDNRNTDGRNEMWPRMFESRKDILARTHGLRLITDDNMLSEWAVARR